MLRVLAVIAAFALLVYALSDFATSDERDRGGIPKWLWVIIIVVLVYFGPLAWIAYSRSRRSAAAAPAARGGFPGAAPRGRRRPGQPVAPDDDPDFLWRLARDQREQARKDRGEGVGTDGAVDDSAGADGAADAPGTDHGDLLADDPRDGSTDDLLPGDPRGDSTDDVDGGGTPPKGPSV
ncbi:hypothetical protein Sked_07240 [Sanguibacter keddieii DSM 10542]|uniref:Cardiolipin synthase N-terminal domain-containing protein n=1 Tax=Sanguibacter keddieii (strain ATCC 51767 / DSM 10542 / NCFB 3025 / ST-74) TaxID=446469 RepID=D1BBB4_SANKS|nr:PLD nuclease N-terminal domain-containing protein [Sanguibacter keddieii]ACZ20680.1 hypothetical protein Sked_07240 [Sanguibacter keddieii DSM 10542]